MNSGIYTITSPSGNLYVGSTVDFDKRWRTHCSHLRHGTHHSKALQSAWNKYGEASMKFCKLIICKEDMLIFYEQRAIDKLKPKYNMKIKAGNSAGWKHTAETKAKMSAQRTGVKQSAERVANRVAKVTGRKHTEEAKAKISAGRIGIRHSREVIEKIIEKKKGIKFGPMSEEHKRKIGLANSNRQRSEKELAAYAKGAERLKNLIQTEEQKAKRLASYMATVAKRKALKNGS